MQAPYVILKVAAGIFWDPEKTWLTQKHRQSLRVVAVVVVVVVVAALVAVCGVSTLFLKELILNKSGWCSKSTFGIYKVNLKERIQIMYIYIYR